VTASVAATATAPNMFRIVHCSPGFCTGID
jgi:hypothetical protein